MNALMKSQIHDDYKKILSTDAGKRIFGGIFDTAKMNITGVTGEYFCGVRDLAIMIANTIREVAPLGVAECEIAYKDFKERFDDDGRRDDTDD